MGLCELSDFGEGIAFVLLEGELLAVVAEGLEFGSLNTLGVGLVGGEKGPGGVEVDGSIELLSSVVESQDRSVYSDHVSDSLDDGEVLELSGVENELSPVVLLS